MSNTPKIDEILREHVVATERIIDSKPIPSIQLCKDQLYQLILEVIGEDEFSGNPKWCTYRNELRQEQRQKLSDLFNITQ